MQMCGRELDFRFRLRLNSQKFSKARTECISHFESTVSLQVLICLADNMHLSVDFSEDHTLSGEMEMSKRRMDVKLEDHMVMWGDDGMNWDASQLGCQGQLCRHPF